MKRQFSIEQILLWIFVVALGIELGGGLYETLVVMPVWVSSPPDSVIAFYRHNAANPQFALSAGPRFWMFMTPLVGLSALAALFSGLRTRPEHRKWRIAGTVLALVVVVATFAWFVPNIIRLNSEAVLTMSGEDVKSLTNWWVRLNWVRAVVYSAGWLAALKAFSIPSKI
jgi:Domain of unknown function (DUF1772)